MCWTDSYKYTNYFQNVRIMNKLFIIALLTLTGMSNAMAQQEVALEEKVYEVVEEMPSFPGGQGAMFEFIANNIQYPIVAEENGVQGRVLVSFVIKKDGSLSNVRVVKSVDSALDKEAVRLIKSMPKWSPGKEKGQFVNVKFTVPVTFRLQ